MHNLTLQLKGRVVLVFSIPLPAPWLQLWLVRPHWHWKLNITHLDPSAAFPDLHPSIQQSGLPTEEPKMRREKGRREVQQEEIQQHPMQQRTFEEIGYLWQLRK